MLSMLIILNSFTLKALKALKALKGYAQACARDRICFEEV